MTNILRINEEELFTEDDYIPYWKGSRFTGIGYEETDNGIIYKETSYQDGMKHGIYHEFDLKGNLLTKGYFEQNEAVGAWKYWYTSGILKQVHMAPSNRKSYIIEWSENGSLLSKKFIHKLGPRIIDHYSKEQLFYENEVLREERIYEYQILKRAKTWDESGNFLDSYQLEPENNKYGYWKSFHEESSTKNPFRFSK